MAILHIVMFKFRPSAEPSKVHEVCTRMVNLRSECIHPSSQKPYIINSSGGRQNSPEDNAADFSHAFVLEFSREEDREYYLKEDPTHLAFKKSLAGVVEKVGVVDYVPGVF